MLPDIERKGVNRVAVAKVIALSAQTYLRVASVFSKVAWLTLIHADKSKGN
ncbi:MAG: hypothetical protein H0A75_07970 [Candidatus Methanofishera endochildressiae]|uniref:Uncharacterized protein n=1 Tax=Candidatus Methanofishera endochildressiae TaxID=2738884 RepID=A0A7Z0MQG8_9GAMM|nr:hypothetical protein [Candidatus Methanofishera endochildressiae]